MMKEWKETLKYFIAGVFRNFLKIFYFLPIFENKILFCSHHGKQYSCNPRFIYEALYVEYKNNIKYVWVSENGLLFEKLKNNDNTIPCKAYSIKYYYHLLTSKIIIINCKMQPDMPKRAGQKVVLTWHGGGCYKNVGVENLNICEANIKEIIRSSQNVDYFISSSEYFSNVVIKRQYRFKNTILEIGMPRNDVFFHNDTQRINEIKDELLLEDYFVILYAPTWRDLPNNKCVELIDVLGIKEAVEKKYKKKSVFLYRGHHTGNKEKNEWDVDVSGYYDMQDLLLVCDMLITDYSSSIWDFSYTYKPCLLYTPDLDEYRQYRGFGTDIYQWGFPVCVTNDELYRAISNFDQEEFILNMKKHHNDLGSFEKGNATNFICDVIRKNINCLNKGEYT